MVHRYFYTKSTPVPFIYINNVLRKRDVPWSLSYHVIFGLFYLCIPIVLLLGYETERRDIGLAIHDLNENTKRKLTGLKV